MEQNSRRKFLTRVTGGVVGLGALGMIWPLFRSLIPNALYEPPKRFKIGTPDEYPQGVTFLDDRRIYLFREGNRFHAVSAVCSHLGCTVKFAPYRTPQEETVRSQTFVSFGEFHCPCHGSKFHGEGTNYSGPAPRPLKWFALEISSEDGQLRVDLAQEVNRDFRLVV